MQKSTPIPGLQLSELTQSEHYKPFEEMEHKEHPWIPFLSSPKVTTAEIGNIFELDISEII